ncbi:DeoR family transcriptional regulator [Plantibacter sp. Leaf171]|uniref:DeoR/GlpR family DNA-binding transcription regulator n=1 Tax=unclassified Plantibacter TaxID=2624265 RepID=UPI0006F385C5|nr:MULTISPECIES: DeoR/GlpR family DNA-binding transcription regulator [unclassified Plantibacter]KQM17655.1 DeoR family transcriptional regulator [Plantibacter sp. Leaf1]KQR60436.1 DeoR family transcriptional regulator [Plantibacter sp. Leaf171]
MLSAQRRTHLLDLLERDGRIVAKEAAAALGVSEDSIRRDLRDLADAGQCIRVYGGALPVPAADRPFAERLSLETDSKERVARVAAARILPGSTVIIDAGTTALALARLLPDDPTLTVITPSPAVALAVAEHSPARVIMVGGELGRHSMVTNGALATEAIRRLSADACFLGVTGVHPEHGLTTGELDDAATKRALAERSTEVYVLASEEKIGAVSRYPVLDLDEVTEVIVDPEGTTTTP